MLRLDIVFVLSPSTRLRSKIHHCTKWTIVIYSTEHAIVVLYRACVTDCQAVDSVECADYPTYRSRNKGGSQLWSYWAAPSAQAQALFQQFVNEAPATGLEVDTDCFQQRMRV